MEKSDIGLIGLAVMGQNLALNIERNGFSVGVFNRTVETKDEFLDLFGDYKNIKGYDRLVDLVESLKKPRKIILMVKAGNPVDQIIGELEKYLDPDDLIIDGGNSNFKDTQRRYSNLKDKGYHFMGVGISGGEEGALNGPSIMPGGSKIAWEKIKPILLTIAATVNGDRCCTYIGSDGAGHFVKMVHNGIEYAVMQLIAEAYSILKNLLRLGSNELSKIFEEWQAGDLNSYLIQITEKILSSIDPETGKPIIDIIADNASQKGTGKWTVENALELGVPIPSISEAVFARYLSGIKTERVHASHLLSGPEWQVENENSPLVKIVERGLFVATLCAYSQGFSLLRIASTQYNWELNLGKIAAIWRGGCIIRAQFLDRIKTIYEEKPDLPNLLLDPYFIKTLEENQKAWREVVTLAVISGIPIPGFSSTLAYFDGYRSRNLSTNLIQAQREFFGAHGFSRVDKELDKQYHHHF